MINVMTQQQFIRLEEGEAKYAMRNKGAMSACINMGHALNHGTAYMTTHKEFLRITSMGISFDGALRADLKSDHVNERIRKRTIRTTFADMQRMLKPIKGTHKLIMRVGDTAFTDPPSTPLSFNQHTFNQVWKENLASSSEETIRNMTRKADDGFKNIKSNTFTVDKKAIKREVKQASFLGNYMTCYLNDVDREAKTATFNTEAGPITDRYCGFAKITNIEVNVDPPKEGFTYSLDLLKPITDKWPGNLPMKWTVREDNVLLITGENDDLSLTYYLANRIME